MMSYSTIWLNSALSCWHTATGTRRGACYTGLAVGSILIYSPSSCLTSSVKTSGKCFKILYFHNLLTKQNCCFKKCACLYFSVFFSNKIKAKLTNQCGCQDIPEGHTCSWWHCLKNKLLISLITSLFLMQSHLESLSLGCWMCSMSECFLGFVIWRLVYSCKGLK